MRGHRGSAAHQLRHENFIYANDFTDRFRSMTPLFVIVIIPSAASVVKITAFFPDVLDNLTSDNNLENDFYVRR
jgi:hypothetical protein